MSFSLITMKPHYQRIAIVILLGNASYNKYTPGFTKSIKHEIISYLFLQVTVFLQYQINGVTNEREFSLREAKL